MDPEIGIENQINHAIQLPVKKRKKGKGRGAEGNGLYLVKRGLSYGLLLCTFHISLKNIEETRENKEEAFSPVQLCIN